MSAVPAVSSGRMGVAYAFLGLLVALAATLAFVTAAAVGDSDAVVAEKAELLADLRARALPVSRGGGPAVPPEAAYLAGETEAVAANLLLETVTRAVEAAGGNPATVGVTEIVDGIAGSRRIDVEIAFTATVEQVQAALFALETGTPYVVTAALNLASEAAAESLGDDPRLRVTLRVSGYWRAAATPAPPAGASGT